MNLLRKAIQLVYNRVLDRPIQIINIKMTLGLICLLPWWLILGLI